MSASLAAAAFALWRQRRKIAMAVLQAGGGAAGDAFAAEPDEPVDEPVRFGRKSREGGPPRGGPPEGATLPPPLSFGRRAPGSSKKYARVSADLDLDEMI